MNYDIHYEKVSLLLPMTGSNNSPFTDYSQSQKTINTYGNARISTEQPDSGEGSGYFDGSASYLSIQRDQSLEFGTISEQSSFTIEFEIYPISNTGIMAIVNHGLPGSGGNGNGGWRVISNNGKITFQAGQWNGSSGAAYYEAISSIPLNQRTHVAIGCLNGVISIYYNDIKQNGSFSLGSSFIGINTEKPTFEIVIGCSQPDSINNRGNYLNGLLQYLRITKDINRYTGSGNPPSSALPTRGPIIHPIAGTAKFTDGAIATLARAWRSDTGALVGQVTPDAETGSFEIEGATTECDIAIFRDDYRPLMHGPIAAIIE